MLLTLTMASHAFRPLYSVKLAPLQQLHSLHRLFVHSGARASSSTGVQAIAMDPRATRVLNYWCVASTSLQLDVDTSCAVSFGRHEQQSDEQPSCRIGEGHATLPTEYSDPAWGKRWFGGGDEQDKEIKDKFGADVQDMRAGKLGHWRNSEFPYECLAGKNPSFTPAHSTLATYSAHWCLYSRFPHGDHLYPASHTFIQEQRKAADRVRCTQGLAFHRLAHRAAVCRYRVDGSVHKEHVPGVQRHVRPPSLSCLLCARYWYAGLVKQGDEKLL